MTWKKVQELGRKKLEKIKIRKDNGPNAASLRRAAAGADSLNQLNPGKKPPIG